MEFTLEIISSRKISNYIKKCYNIHRLLRLNLLIANFLCISIFILE